MLQFHRVECTAIGINTDEEIIVRFIVKYHGDSGK
jgi:hypothetical protein